MLNELWKAPSLNQLLLGSEFDNRSIYRLFYENSIEKKQFFELEMVFVRESVT